MTSYTLVLLVVAIWTNIQYLIHLHQTLVDQHTSKRSRNACKIEKSIAHIAISTLTAYSQVAQVTFIETIIKCAKYIQYFICEEVHMGYLANRGW